MLVFRWQAPLLPTKKQILSSFESEGLKPCEELLPPKSFIQNHSHPFDEVRVIISGELIIDISGNKLLLRPGDKIVIPSNTKHSKEVDGEKECLCICAIHLY